MNQDRRTTQSLRVPAWIISASIAAIIIGAGSFIAGFIFAPGDAWLWMLINFVYFAGLAHGMLIWSAAFRVAQTRWTPAINRLGHSAVTLIPVLLVILIVLLSGAKYYMPWVIHPVPAKAGWLNVPFLIIRNVVFIFALWISFILLVRLSLLADARSGALQNYHPKLNTVGTITLFIYTITGSIIAYDFIMSLDPRWVSTMFAPYFWITNAYLGLAALILLAAILRGPLGAERYLGGDQFRDMGNLMLGFSLFSMGLFFAQYLTIWYGNLPEETPFLIIRYDKGAWPWLGWTAFILGYGIPFILLQSRRLKRNPKLLSPVAILVMLGVALERYVLIVPSIEPQRLMLFPVLVLSILFFLGFLTLGIIVFFRRYSPVSSADADLHEYDMKLEVT